MTFWQTIEWWWSVTKSCCQAVVVAGICWYFYYDFIVSHRPSFFYPRADAEDPWSGILTRCPFAERRYYPSPYALADWAQQWISLVAPDFLRLIGSLRILCITKGNTWLDPDELAAQELAASADPSLWFAYSHGVIVARKTRVSANIFCLTPESLGRQRAERFVTKQRLSASFDKNWPLCNLLRISLQVSRSVAIHLLASLRCWTCIVNQPCDQVIVSATRSRGVRVRSYHRHRRPFRLSRRLSFVRQRIKLQKHCSQPPSAQLRQCTSVDPGLSVIRNAMLRQRLLRPTSGFSFIDSTLQARVSKRLDPARNAETTPDRDAGWIQLNNPHGNRLRLRRCVRTCSHSDSRGSLILPLSTVRGLNASKGIVVLVLPASVSAEVWTVRSHVEEYVWRAGYATVVVGGPSWNKLQACGPRRRRLSWLRQSSVSGRDALVLTKAAIREIDTGDPLCGALKCCNEIGSGRPDSGEGPIHQGRNRVTWQRVRRVKRLPHPDEMADAVLTLLGCLARNVHNGTAIHLVGYSYGALPLMKAAALLGASVVQLTHGSDALTKALDITLGHPQLPVLRPGVLSAVLSSTRAFVLISPPLAPSRLPNALDFEEDHLQLKLLVRRSNTFGGHVLGRQDAATALLTGALSSVAVKRLYQPRTSESKRPGLLRQLAEWDSWRLLPWTPVRTLVLTAQDDPLLAKVHLTSTPMTNPLVLHAVTARGGHCGFWTGGIPRPWAAAFAASLMSLIQETTSSSPQSVMDHVLHSFAFNNKS